MASKVNRPKVGLGVYIVKDGKLLLLKRKGAHGDGSWCAPGGHLENGESFAECAIREAEEEAGVKIDEIKVIGLTNDIFDAEKHYITIATIGKVISGEPKIMEIDKATDIGWFEFDNLPKPMFLPTQNLFLTEFDCLCGSGKKYKKCCGK